MSSHLRALHTGVAGLALLGALAAYTPSEAQTVASEETAHSVRRMLERLPYYGVFDFIVSASIEALCIWLATASKGA